LIVVPLVLISSAVFAIVLNVFSLFAVRLFSIDEYYNRVGDGHGITVPRVSVQPGIH
jgi:hypothetical protein